TSPVLSPYFEPLLRASSGPWVLPPSRRGCLPELEGKQKRRANWVRAACVSISQSVLDSVCTRTRSQHDTALRPSQSNSMGRVTGVEPFFVPSQPGIATENRPAVPPAWSGSGGRVP